MKDSDGGTRPHFYIPHALHGAVKDIADSREIDRGEAYELATRVFVALGNGDLYDPRPEDDDLADVYDELLADCEGVN
jgi:hypothetical protein